MMKEYINDITEVEEIDEFVLQQNNKKQTVTNTGKVINEAMDLCYEEGSSCSRPTTSTDDSLSNEEADYVNQRNNENNNNMSSSDHSGHTAADMQHAALQLSRSRMYSNSFKYPSHTRYPAYNNPHRYAPAPGPGPQYQVSPCPPPVAPHPAHVPVLKKQRHESVV